MDATIVIPTKNAGELLNQVLKMVFAQETKYTFEVICVDSGSKDNTLNIINRYPCKLYQIPAAEFGHGKTRNYGASKGTGEYIIFITQDALPVNKEWLEKFLDAMHLDPDIVGGFGPHRPYPDCNLFDKRDLTLHFQNFGKENTVYYLDDKKRYETEEGYRHMLAFFSDNNACLKRSVWEKYPYADVNFAEDQIWARKMIELGYKKVYCPYAAVYHSHNYAIRTFYQRYFDEYKGLYEIHQFQIAKHWILLFPMWVKHTVMDAKYVRHQHMKVGTKLYWCWYSLRRNYCRYYAGYKGGQYHNYSPRRQRNLDCRISQQYKQRKA